MQPSLTLSVGLPIAISIIMLGLGLSLRLEDFVRVLARPRPVIVALACQVIILPAAMLGSGLCHSICRLPFPSA